MDSRYKLVITIAYFTLAVVAILVVALIAVFRPDATATMIQFIGTVLGIASTGAVTFYMLGKTNEKLERVQAQTNGNLSAKEEEIARLNAELLRANRLAHPDNFDATTGDTVVPARS